jgi:hypothetical protein
LHFFKPLQAIAAAFGATLLTAKNCNSIFPLQFLLRFSLIKMYSYAIAPDSSVRLWDIKHRHHLSM